MGVPYTAIIAENTLTNGIFQLLNSSTMLKVYNVYKYVSVLLLITFSYTNLYIIYGINLRHNFIHFQEQLHLVDFDSYAALLYGK